MNVFWLLGINARGLGDEGIVGRGVISSNLLDMDSCLPLGSGERTGVSEVVCESAVRTV